jgi:hypothetical protein
MSWTVQASNLCRGDLFCAHPDQPWGLPNPLYNEYVSFPRLKLPGSGVDHPPPSSTEVKERVQLHSYMSTPSGPSWPLLEWTLRFTKIHTIKIWHICACSNCDDCGPCCLTILFLVFMQFASAFFFQLVDMLADLSNNTSASIGFDVWKLLSL